MTISVPSSKRRALQKALKKSDLEHAIAFVYSDLLLVVKPILMSVRTAFKSRSLEDLLVIPPY
jgi:hypothetical protein